MSFSAPKDDLTGHHLEGDMRKMIEKGILAGYGNGVYAPDDPVTRAQFATFLSRALNLPEGGQANFSDVTEDYILSDGINRAAAAGLIGGYEDGTFRPDEHITREQIAALIDRALQYKNIKRTPIHLTFTDTNQIQSIFREAVANNTYFGIIGGFPVGNNKVRFGPKEKATRAQSAAFINRMLNVIESGGTTLRHYEIATIQGSSIKRTGATFQSLSAARQNISNPSNQVIVYGQDIVWMNSGLAISRPPQGESLVIIYTNEAMTTQLTYVTSGVEMKYVSTDGTKVKVEIAGRTGYVKHHEVILKPYPLAQERSYYRNVNGDIVHYVYNALTGKYGSYTYGKAPSFMNSNEKYYSWDGIEYYNSSGHVVGKAHQYFNFLPLRTKTNYTAEDLDRYIAYIETVNPNVKNSPMKGLGKTFKEAEKKYQINALYLFAKAIHESNYGMSEIAKQKKNLFGYQAYDKDPLGNAKPFKSYEESVMFVAASMNNRYLTPPANTYKHPQTGSPGSNLCSNDGRTAPCGENYRGAVLGNKGHGMNVRYASDPFWGSKIAGHMYRIDKYLGKKDWNKYTIGETYNYSSILRVRPEPNTTKPEQYSFNGTGYYVTILDSVKTSGETWYKIYSDHKDYEYGYVHGNYVRKIETAK